MAKRHPYKPDGANGFPGPDDLDDTIDQVVRAGKAIGSTVLGSIGDALRTVGEQLRGEEVKDFASFRRSLDRRLAKRREDNLALAIVGWIFCGIFGVAGLVMGILAAAAVHSPALFPESSLLAFGISASVFLPIALGFGVMGVLGCRGLGRLGRLRRYLHAAKGLAVPVKTMAQASGLPQDKVREELKKAVGSDLLPDAVFDGTGETFYLDATLCAPPDAVPEPDAPLLTDAERFRRDGAGFLNYLRACTGKLGPAADGELARMQTLCAAIQNFGANHPDQLGQLRRFREYYQPTTRKLLDTALGLGDADAAGANAIRQDITGILHTLNTAYEKLYDTLLQDVSLDVSTEIDTLEAMLRQDGLTHDFTSDFGAEKTNP